MSTCRSRWKWTRLCLQNSVPVCPKNAFRIRRIKSIRRACLFAFVFNHRITHRKLYPLILRRIAVCKDMKAKDRAHTL